MRASCGTQTDSPGRWRADLLVLLVLACSLLGCGSSSGKQQATLVSPVDKSRQHGPFVVGDVVAIGRFRLATGTVTDPFVPPPTPPNPYPGALGRAPEPGRRFVRINVKLENLSGSALVVSPEFSFSMRGDDVHDYAPDTLNTLFRAPADKLAPHSGSDGVLLFAVPTPVRVTLFSFHPYLPGSGQSGEVVEVVSR